MDESLGNSEHGVLAVGILSGDAVLTCSYTPMFCRNILPPSSDIKVFLPLRRRDYDSIKKEITSHSLTGRTFSL
jgi:hypothetical protein